MAAKPQKRKKGGNSGQSSFFSIFLTAVVGLVAFLVAYPFLSGGPGFEVTDEFRKSKLLEFLFLLHN
jgi:hypothetical protein